MVSVAWYMYPASALVLTHAARLVGLGLRSSSIRALAMALHELATNAVKYGALAQPAGRLHIRWSFESTGAQNKPWLHIEWHESGVAMPPVGSVPQGTGQRSQSPSPVRHRSQADA